MSSMTNNSDDIHTIQLGVEVGPFLNCEDNLKCTIIKESSEIGDDPTDNGISVGGGVVIGDTSGGTGGGDDDCEGFECGLDEKDSVPSNRNSINFGRFQSTSSSPGSTPIKSVPSTPNRIKRSESSSSVIGLLSLTPSTPMVGGGGIGCNPPSSPLTKCPPSPTIDEGPTIGVLEPEMFTGGETIVVPSEPDLANYNTVELITIGEEKAKFQFSSNHNNVTFHRRFPQVDPSERLINYYSCALQADILLQGFLYITENFFAFYSNILGLYKTKLLVPVCDVRDITKEKTAIFIPNAVGIETHEGKYVFSSLLSRESTYRLMVEVWKNTISMDTFPFDQLRPAQDTITDNGNSSPSTPTKTDNHPSTSSALKSIVSVHVNGDNIISTGQLSGLIEGGGGVGVGGGSGGSLTVGQVSASSSLKRNAKLVRRSKGKQQHQRQGFHNCSDTSDTPETTSDADYGAGDDNMIVGRGASGNSKETGHRKSKLMIDGWRRLSLTIKSLGERLKSELSTPFLHIAIIILLTYLLISTICMIHRINLLQNLFESLTSNPKAQRILNNIQVEQIRIDLSKNMIKMDDLKSSLLNLLDSVEKVFNSNCVNPRDDNPFNSESMVMNTCSPPSAPPPPPPVNTP